MVGTVRDRLDLIAEIATHLRSLANIRLNDMTEEEREGLRQSLRMNAATLDRCVDAVIDLLGTGRDE